jgi:excisionase family DNA binding protein
MAHHKQIPKTFCTTREAADLLGVSLRTAQLWAESGLLEAWKTGGGHRRIARQSIERLLANPEVRGIQLGATPRRRADDLVPVATLAPFNILVVEDDPVLRRLYEIKIRSWPMKPNISTAGDGYEALIRMGNSRPDLLIADLQMAGMDGFRMLQTISSSPELAGMTIVVVSGLDAEEIAHRGTVPEGIPVLPKPVPFDQLRDIAERLEAGRQAPGRTEPA